MDFREIEEKTGQKEADIAQCACPSPLLVVTSPDNVQLTENLCTSKSDGTLSNTNEKLNCMSTAKQRHSWLEVAAAAKAAQASGRSNSRTGKMFERTNKWKQLIMKALQRNHSSAQCSENVPAYALFLNKKTDAKGQRGNKQSLGGAACLTSDLSSDLQQQQQQSSYGSGFDSAIASTSAAYGSSSNNVALAATQSNCCASTCAVYDGEVSACELNHRTGGGVNRWDGMSTDNALHVCCSTDGPNSRNLSSNDSSERKKKKSIGQDFREKLSSFTRRQTDATNNQTKNVALKDAEKVLKQNRPSLELVQRWGDDFDSLLNDKYGLALFRGFLRTEFSDENIEFWISCEEYKTLVGLKKQQIKAQKIYLEFVAVQAPREVNLDSTTRLQTIDALNSPDKHTFENAQKRIQALMERDSYKRFLRSELYNSLLREIRASSLVVTTVASSSFLLSNNSTICSKSNNSNGSNAVPALAIVGSLSTSTAVTTADTVLLEPSPPSSSVNTLSNTADNPCCDMNDQLKNNTKDGEKNAISNVTTASNNNTNSTEEADNVAVALPLIESYSKG